MADDDDDAIFGGLYENGHWVWDETTESLLFVSDLPPALIETVQITNKAPTGTIEFRDDVDLIEQVRYRRRYQRKSKTGKIDVVTLQDIKDIALYTAPLNILSPMLINLLHLPTTERFLRALIFCCAYYVQVTEEMTNRIIELTTKIRTPDCEVIEKVFRENLADLRILVAKEYCVLLIGGGDLKKFHHMGSNKKRQSLSDKDSRLFETFVRICVQIVYLALGRRYFHQIEMETHRILKSEIFNPVERTQHPSADMMPEERAVLLGPCLNTTQKLNTRSPLLNEVFCHRPIDYRLLGLGVVKYKHISARLHYLYLVVAGPEEALLESHVTVGIIGMARSLFDTMLHPIVLSSSDGKSKGSMSSQISGYAKSANMMRKSQQALQRFYPPIELPPKEPKVAVPLPPDFPETPEDIPPVSETQHRRWQKRFRKLTKPATAGR